MLSQTSRFAVQPAERPILAPVWLIALLAALVGGSLVLLYPRQDLERRLAASVDSADVALSVSYLLNLLRSDPGNTRLRLLMAHQQMILGELEQARETLRHVADSQDPQVQREILWTNWELTQAEYWSIAEHEEELRQTKQVQIREQLHLLMQHEWAAERQAQLGQWVAQSQDPATAALTHRQLAERERDPHKAALLYEQAAREALGLSDYDTCAQLYLLARRTTTDTTRARAYFFAALDALQSANRPADALALGEREIGDLDNDPETLLRMVHLARAAARPAVADRYMRQLLRVTLSLPASPPNTEPAMALGAPLHEGALRPVVLRVEPPAQPAPAAKFDDGAHWLQPPLPATTHLPGWRALATAQPGRGATPPSIVPGLPFDDKIYTLAYQVFLENRKPEDAWAIARAAVHQRPGDMAWRERLARVSEWTERPAVALENWLMLARQTQNPEAWQAVLRIAPGQFDDAALVQALHYQLRTKPGDPTLVRALVDAYERLGEPQPALDYLLRNAKTPQEHLWLAQLAERVGRPDIALQSWRAVLADPAHATAENAMHAAILALSHNQPEQGLRWLEAVQNHPVGPETGPDLWRLTGELAETRERYPLAIAAYQKLVATPKAQIADFDAFIRVLLPDQPLQAAQASLLAWERHSQPRHLVQTLTLWSSRNEWQAFAPVLQRIQADPEAQRSLLQSTQFLRLVGTYHQNAGRFTQAQQYYEAGLRSAPDSSDMRQALLWLFIDSNDATSLRRLLAEHEPTWSRSEEVHEALAAAYQALSLPQVALERYLTPQVKQHQGDFLWLMNYADALDQNQQTDRAWRLRRHLMSHEWQTMRQGLEGRRLTLAQARQRWLTEEGLDTTRRIARTRLVLTQQPGDPAIQVLRELLRLDRDARGGYSNAAAETAIGWLQDAGEYTAERGFLWHQYARSQSLRSNRPLWAEITVALAEDDKAATGQLLETFDERLPRYDRVNAARAVHDLRLAQSAAFEAQEYQHDDQPLHQQLTESLLAFSDHAGITARAQSFSGLDERRLDETAHIAIHPRLSLDLRLSRTLREATRADTVTAPPHETAAQARLNWRHADGETRVTLAERRSFATYHPLELEHEQRIDNRLQLNLSVGQNLPTQDSLALRIAGMKDRVSAALRYQLTRQDALTITLWGERYQLQTGGALGTGRHAMAYYTHTYRQDAPLLEFSAFASYHGYRRADLSQLSARDEGYRRYLPAGADGPGIDYFLPDSFRFYGVQASSNMRFEEEYSRKLRPYGLVSATWHSRHGAGYGLRLGLATSIFGADHLRLSWGYEKGGLKSEAPSRDLEISYRLHF